MTEGNDRMPAGLGDLLHYTHATSIVGDILKIQARDVGLGDIALVEMPDGDQSLAQAIQLEEDEVSLQVFWGRRRAFHTGNGAVPRASVAGDLFT